MGIRHSTIVAFAVLLCSVSAGEAWPRTNQTQVEMRASPPSDEDFQANDYEGVFNDERAIPDIIQIAPGTDERPVLLPTRNIYQIAPHYPESGAMICGAAAMANAPYYLRFYYRPQYFAIAKDSMPTPWSDRLMVQEAFDDCEVDKFHGVGAGVLRRCAGAYFEAGDYSPLAWLISPTHSDAPLRRTPQPEDLRALIDRGAAVILLLSWFSIDEDGVYVRDGGHFVMLAGYDAADRTRFYVSDPLVDYDSINSDQYDANVSALVFEQVSAERRYAYRDNGAIAPLDLGTAPIWQTRDRFHSDLAIMQIALVMGEPAPGIPQLAQNQ